MQDPFIVYDPTKSARQQLLERSKALSHAAKAYHNRRKRPGQPKYRLVQEKDEPTDSKCTCRHDCDCKRPIDSECLRFQLLPRNTTNDPFGGLPIVMTPAIHETIVFWAKPALWDCIHNYSHGKSSKSYFRLELERDILNLQNELDAIMFLYQSAALMWALYRTEVLEKRKLRLKRQALQVLRESIEHGDASPNQDSYINALICATMAALCEGDEKEARLHGTQIQLLVKTLEDAEDTPRIIALTARMGRVFFFDVLFALVRGRHVVFHEAHLPNHMQDMIRSQNEWIRSLHLYAQSRITFKAPISQKLIDIFCGWRIDMILYGEPPVDSATFDAMAAFYYTFATSHRLYEETLVMMQQPTSDNKAPSSDPLDVQIRNVEVALSAALMFQISILQHIIEPVGEVAYGNGVVHKLKEILGPTIGDTQQLGSLQEAQLWALYAGACWEITYLHHATSVSKWVPWFVQALRKKATSMGVKNWQQANQIFEQYWPSNLMSPNGAEFFDLLMLTGTVRINIRGDTKNCCWQQACTLRPKRILPGSV